MSNIVVEMIVGSIAFALIVMVGLYLLVAVPAPEPFHSQIIVTYYNSIVLISIAGTIGFITLLIGLLRGDGGAI